MKHTRLSLAAVSMAVVLSLVLAACGPKATPGPVVLTVSGSVGSQLSLTDADLHGMATATISATPPKQTAAQSYTGVRFSDLMDKAQVSAQAASMVMTGSDGYSATIDLPTLKGCSDCMVAFTSTPGTLYAVMPGQPGKVWVQNLIKIEFK
ncbi:MAG: molybdopterin-dependent oxidoreductase [Anaerolineales bacterium]